MNTYVAPIREITFAMMELAGMKQISLLADYETTTPDLVDAILEEAGKFASEVLAPINKIGDTQGSHLEEGKVILPKGFIEAYQQFQKNGWAGISQSPEFDGQGLPALMHTAASEMWQSANLAFALCPMLTTGAIEAIQAHASEALKQSYLPKMVSGEWTGTMNLTEPQAGSDLAAIRAKAIPHDDHYLISGQKIFITWGDHEATENIVHLVLARLPDAPAGAKGISLFLVPKHTLNADGSMGQANDVRPVSLEHKLGIHASPTCVMSFGDNGGAVGYLIGEENNGLACMFTMMNNARLEVGIQGVAISERAYQQAVGYARERVQGSAPDVEGRSPIINHPDVRRMLMLMRAQVEATRALVFIGAESQDLAHKTDDAATRTHYDQRLNLLTPIIKAWSTEVAQEVTSLGVQVHGGMGYIEETGAAQHFRDARITTIYEGTTGIQANDLIGRKVLHDGGRAIKTLLREIEAFEAQMTDIDDLADMSANFTAARNKFAECVDWLLENGQATPFIAGSVAVNFLMLTGTVLGGWQMVRAALVAHNALAQGTQDDAFYRAKINTAQFYSDHILPRYKSYSDAVLAADKAIMALPVEAF